jgi:hypothetical protein
MMMRVMMFIYDEDESDVYNDDENDIQIWRVIYDDEKYDDDLCVCIRVVHFSGSLALICELSEYVYTCVTCRIYLYAFI